MLASNIAAGLLGSAWTAVLGFAVVPIYLNLLGLEAYGLIGFFATLQAVFQLLDMGIAPTLNREVARRSAHGRIGDAALLLRTLAWIYWTTALLIGVAVWLASPFIAEHWLRSRQLSPALVQDAVALLGVVIALRWPNGIYLGVLLGAQRVQLSSAVTAATATVTSGGAVLILTFVSPTLEAFFGWQICAALAGTLAMQRAAWRALGGPPKLGLAPSLAVLRPIWRFSASMGALGVLALVFTQIDKILLSRLLDLGDFGRYMVAAAVAGGLYVFVTPFFNAVYPRLSVLVARGDAAGLESSYRLATVVLASILFPVAALLALYSVDVIELWTRNADLARATGPVVSLLAIGSALHGVMHRVIQQLHRRKPVFGRA